MALMLAGVVALVGLIISPGYLFYFDVTPKIVVLLGGTALVLVWAAWGGVGFQGRPRLLMVFSALLLLNMVSLALSTAFSVRPALSLFGTNWRRYGSVIQGTVCLFAWLIALACAGQPQRVRTVLRGVTAAGAVSALYGIAQYFGWDPFLPAAGYHVGEGIWTIVRPPGTLGYASYFATWLLFVVFLSLALHAMEDSAAWRRLAEATAVLATFAMLLTGTRAAVLGLLAGGMVWTLVRKVRVTRRSVVWTGVVLLAGAAFYFAPPGQQLRSRARWFVEDPWGGSRRELWRDSLRMASHRLAAGYGPEVFSAEFPRFESVELAKAYPNFAHESPHNLFLDALVAQGAPGLLLLVAVCATALVAAFRLKQPGFAAALAAGLVSQQFTAFTVPTAMMIFVTSGLLVALGTPAAGPRRRFPVMAGAALLAAVLLYCAARFTVADHALALTKGRLDHADLAQAEVEYQRYQRLRLPGGSSDLWYSRAVLAIASRALQIPVRLEAVRESGTAAVHATQTAEDPFNAWYNLAVFCGSQNDAACVEHSLQAAIAAHALWYKPHWTLAQVFRMEGRMEEARREAVRASELNDGKDPEVARTLQEIRLASTKPNSLQK